MIFENYDRIVFAGDSVTDMGSVQPVGEGIFDNTGRGYVRVIESLIAVCYPELSIRVTNSGVNGDTSRDLLRRFERDVVSLKPDWVSICIGINDVWRQFDCPSMPDVQVFPDEYRSNLEKMILQVKDSVKGIFLLTPYYIEANREDFMRAKMDEYVAICREVSEKYGCIFVDLQKMFEDFCKIKHSSYVAWDRVHPNQIGSTLMAREFLKHCDFDFNNGGF